MTSLRYIIILGFFAILINTSSIALIGYFLSILSKHPEMSQEQYIVSISLVNLLALLGALRTWIVFNSNVSKRLFGVKTLVQFICIFEGFFLMFYMYTDIEYKNAIIIGFIFESSSFALETRRYLTRSSQSPITVDISRSSRVQPVNTVYVKIEDHTCDTQECSQCTCPVCLNEHIKYIMLDCKHSVCTECIYTLFNTTNKCPYCRQIMHSFQNQQVTIVIESEPLSEVPV